MAIKKREISIAVICSFKIGKCYTEIKYTEHTNLANLVTQKKEKARIAGICSPKTWQMLYKKRLISMHVLL